MDKKECNFWFPRTQSWLEPERNKHSYLWCIYWEEEEGGTQKAWTNKTELELTLLQDMEHLSVFSTHIHTIQHHLHLPYSKIQLYVFCLLKTVAWCCKSQPSRPGLPHKHYEWFLNNQPDSFSHSESTRSSNTVNINTCRSGLNEWSSDESTSWYNDKVIRNDTVIGGHGFSFVSNSDSCSSLLARPQARYSLPQDSPPPTSGSSSCSASSSRPRSGPWRAGWRARRRLVSALGAVRSLAPAPGG